MGEAAGSEVDGDVDGEGVRDRVRRVEESLEALERLPAGPRETATAALRALVGLYGEGWSRVLAHLERESPDAVASLVADDLVGHLLLVHDLHPQDVEARVEDALERVRPEVATTGRGLILVEIEQGTARVAVVPEGRDRSGGSMMKGGAGSGIAGTGDAPRAAGGEGREKAVAALVEAAVLGIAPEVERVVVEGLEPATSLVQIEPRRPSASAGGAGS